MTKLSEAETTLAWLAIQFRDRANEDPAPNTEQDADQVEAALKAVRDVIALATEQRTKAYHDYPDYYHKLSRKVIG